MALGVLQLDGELVPRAARVPVAAAEGDPLGARFEGMGGERADLPQPLGVAKLPKLPGGTTTKHALSVGVKFVFCGTQPW